jgi:hypothetical protein
MRNVSIVNSVEMKQIKDQMKSHDREKAISSCVNKFLSHGMAQLFIDSSLTTK